MFLIFLKAIQKGLDIDPSCKETFDVESKNCHYLERHSDDLDSALEANDYRKALFHIDQCLNVAVASKRLKIKKAECLAYLGKAHKASGLHTFQKKSVKLILSSWVFGLLGTYFNWPIDWLQFFWFHGVLFFRTIWRSSKHCQWSTEKWWY